MVVWIPEEELPQAVKRSGDWESQNDRAKTLLSLASPRLCKKLQWGGHEADREKHNVGEGRSTGGKKEDLWFKYAGD